LEAAYLFYYASDVAFAEDSEADSKLKKRLETLVGDALIIANLAKFDVFNALTLMDNCSFLESLKVCLSFREGNMYLWLCDSSVLVMVFLTSICTTGEQRLWQAFRLSVV